MPPAKPRPQQDDSRSEASSTKEKGGSNPTTAINGKGRRVGGSTGTGSGLRDVVTAGPSTTSVGASGNVPAEINPGVGYQLAAFRAGH